MKVKVRKSQARKIKALIKDKRTRHKDVDSFVEAAVTAAIKAAPKAKAGKARPAQRAKAKRARKRPTRRSSGKADAAPTGTTSA